MTERINYPIQWTREIRMMQIEHHSQDCTPKFLIIEKMNMVRLCIEDESGKFSDGEIFESVMAAKVHAETLKTADTIIVGKPTIITPEESEEQLDVAIKGTIFYLCDLVLFCYSGKDPWVLQPMEFFQEKLKNRIPPRVLQGLLEHLNEMGMIKFESHPVANDSNAPQSGFKLMKDGIKRLKELTAVEQ